MIDTNMNEDFGREPREYYESKAREFIATWPADMQEHQHVQDQKYYNATKALDKSEDKMLRVLSGRGDETAIEEIIRECKLHVHELQSGQVTASVHAVVENRISKDWITNYITTKMKL